MSRSRPTPARLTLWLLAAGLVAAPAPVLAQDALPPLPAYRSRLDVEPREQLLTINQRCAALFGLMASWVVDWDPDGAAAFRSGRAVFRGAAVRSRASAGASAAEADRATGAAVDDLIARYRARTRGTPTAPALAADDFLQADLQVCRDMLDVLSGSP